ncbi:MAG: Thioesterase [Bacteroidetes bacterium]|nr:Thioesterase [Bacteroidota bacterium]
MQRTQVFFFHFAGGNSYSFQFLAPFLKNADLFPLELPGRGKRYNEQLLTDFDQAALDLYAQIKKLRSSSRYIIYGHSMGATLALTVAGMLEKDNDAPFHIIVSGNPGPGVREKKNRYLLNHEDFINELKVLGGMPEEVMANEELLNFFEPVLRADFELVEKYDANLNLKIRTPIFAMMGSDENESQRILNWKKHTVAGFDYAILEGGHFFIHNNAEKVAEVISAKV